MIQPARLDAGKPRSGAVMNLIRNAICLNATSTAFTMASEEVVDVPY
jgi:hypothetical protein